MRFLVPIMLAVFMSSAASAQQRIYSFDQDTIFKSMQCEMGLFAAAARKANLPADMRAHIKYSTSGTAHANASASAGIADLFNKVLQGPKLTASLDFTRVNKSTIEGKMNIHQGNMGACLGARKKVPAVPLGVYEWLSQSTTTLAGGFTASTTNTVTVKAAFDASGKFVFWVVSIGPELAGDYTVTYTIDMDAPATDDAKKTAENK